MKSIFAENYALKFSNMIKDSNPFYRFMRYCYGVDNVLRKHEELIAQNTQEGVCRVLTNVTKNVMLTSTKYNWFSRKILGFKNLIAAYESLTWEAKERRCDSDLIVNDKGLGALKMNVKSKVKKGTFANISRHLTDQQKFIKQIKVRKPNDMPYHFETYGRYNEIHAFARVSGGKPMTYKNLKEEHDKSLKMLDEYRAEIQRIEADKWYTYTTFHTVDTIDGPDYRTEYHCELNPNYEAERECASNYYDACDTARRYVEDWIKELAEFSPYVKIDDKSYAIEYPYKSSLFREARNAKQYREISVWETKEEEHERISVRNK